MKSTAVVTTALIIFALTSCENPADKTADAATKEAVAVETPLSEGEVYVISSESEVGFVGSKVTGSHEGGFKSVSGSFTVKDGEVNGGSFQIDMNSVWSDNEKLTEHLKADDFFNVPVHPLSTFMVTGVEKTDGGYLVSGNLEMRGETKNITFPATATKEGDTIKVNAEFDINRKDWGIVYEGKKDDVIRDEVVIKFDIVATAQAG
ncbi:YceI family protein [Haloferula sp.]|uniref:YceI family protein n=1 Tax=Haloferula sp. TaxID=2497595 RepID=UPI003C777BD3